MTRLVRDDIYEIKESIRKYDKEVFYKQTGCTMSQVARIAAGVHTEENPFSVATVTVTSGLGEISGFADTNTAILKHCGIDAVTMQKTDVAGIQEAFESGRDLIMMADDDIFSIFGAGVKVQSDNGDATGRSYAAALIEAIKNRHLAILGQKILVLGAGPVGEAACDYIAKAGAVPCIFDLDTAKARALCEKNTKAELIERLDSYLDFKYILDASTAKELIDEKDVTEETIISAPGVPCIATKKACEKATVIHNPLELGTIAMYYQCVGQMKESVG